LGACQNIEARSDCTPPSQELRLDGKSKLIRADAVDPHHPIG
jgi:hypothetical protein